MQESKIKGAVRVNSNSLHAKTILLKVDKK